MPDPMTANKFLSQPTRGSDAGTWDTPVNGNMGIIDNSFGGVTTIALTNSPVTLSSGQYQNVFIKLTGAITANCSLSFPGGVGSFFTIINQTTNSSVFVVTMTTTAAGAQTIGLPPGANTKVLIDGTNPQYEALPHHVGEYWLHAASSTPLWVTSCTNPPYLNCDGTTFSSATYPALTVLMGGNTLPDARGRALFAIDQGTGRNGQAVLTGGGTVTIGASHLPAHAHPVSDPGHSHTIDPNNSVGAATSLVMGSGNVTVPHSSAGTYGTSTATTGLTVSNSTYPNSNFLPPLLAHGITMIRAG